MLRTLHGKARVVRGRVNHAASLSFGARAVRWSRALLLGFSLAGLDASTAFAPPAPPDPARPAPDRLWGGCKLTAGNAINEIAGATGLDPADVDFVVVYSLLPNAGQQFGATVAPAVQPFTGPILCTTTGTTETFALSSTESTKLPGTISGGGNNTVNVLSTELSQLVGYDITPPFSTSSRTSDETQFCRTTELQGGCFNVKQLAPGGPCLNAAGEPIVPPPSNRLSATSYSSIVSAIRAGGTGNPAKPGIDGPISFSFIMVYSVKGTAPAAICPAPFVAPVAPDPGSPGYAATLPDPTLPNPTLIPASGGLADVKNTQQGLILTYKINGGTRNGQTEKRLCQTVLDRTDCFRLFQ